MNQQERRKAELSLRKKIKAELMKQQLDAVGFIFCQSCKRKPDWRGISLSHIISLSRGGVTQLDNCILECYDCHSKFEKRPELRIKEV